MKDGRTVAQEEIGSTAGNPPLEKPGDQSDMSPEPEVVPRSYRAAGKLNGKRALITGGDSGIGRSVAVMFAMEGADVAIAYDKSDDDAEATSRLIERQGRRCLKLKGDVGDEKFCREAVERTVRELGGLNILVNNAAEQHPQESIADVTEDQLVRTFRTNFFGYFFMAKHALEHMEEGDSIINTGSVTAFKGSEQLLDYASTKGAIAAFTRSLAEHVKQKKIRVNNVAPGPVWTPLIPSTFGKEKLKEFGAETLWERPAQPGEIAATYVMLASDDGLFYSGQTFHPNGGTIVAS
jgi:NAD(P)-dependent dehydrogenase (short-subunit alcohol dehydrogenase family)